MNGQKIHDRAHVSVGVQNELVVPTDAGERVVDEQRTAGEKQPGRQRSYGVHNCAMVVGGLSRVMVVLLRSPAHSSVLVTFLSSTSRSLFSVSTIGCQESLSSSSSRAEAP